MMIIKKILRILPVIALLMVVSELILANELATMGAGVQKMDNQMTALRDENEILLVQVAEATSLRTLEQKSKALGFVETAPTLKLGSGQYPVALANEH